MKRVLNTTFASSTLNKITCNRMLIIFIEFNIIGSKKGSKMRVHRNEK